MSVRKALILTVFTLSLILLCTVSFALASPVLLQGCAWEDNIDVFVSGELKTNNIKFEVSRQTVDVTEIGRLADKGVTVRTTILLDISTSMPENMRSKVKEYIDYYIEKLDSNEELRIMSFGENLTVLQEFTTDRYDLSRAASSIEFNTQQSMIYDAIYNSIPDIQPLDGKPCYYHTVVITDGSDESITGVTKEELYLKLQQSTYPVDVLAVSEGDRNNFEKELSALTRISGGHYVNFQYESNLEQLLPSKEDIIWIRVKLPSALLDGSTRQFNISDGTNNLQFDYKVPAFGSTLLEDPTENKTESGGETGSLLVNTESSLSEEHSQKVPDTHSTGLKMNSNLVLIAVVGCVAVTVIILSSVLMFLKCKKKKRLIEKEQKIANTDCGSETEVLTGATTIRLRESDNPDKVWEVQLYKAIFVGRDETCQIHIDEGSVSRQQCTLYADDNRGVMIENKSNSNITQVNGVKLKEPQNLNEGDQIKCGRITLVVDFIRVEQNGTSENINKLTKFVNV